MTFNIKESIFYIFFLEVGNILQPVSQLLVTPSLHAKTGWTKQEPPPQKKKNKTKQREWVWQLLISSFAVRAENLTNNLARGKMIDKSIFVTWRPGRDKRNTGLF